MNANPILVRIGKVIAAERMRQGLRPEDLGLDPDDLQRIESGEPGLTISTLESIADELQLDARALRDGEIVQRPRPSIYLRHRPMQDFDSVDAEILDESLEQARGRNALCRILGLDPGEFVRGAFVAKHPAADKPNAPALDGKRLAQEVRSRIQNPEAPLEDLRALFETDLGIAVIVRRFATMGATAMAVKSVDAAAVVLAPGHHRSHLRVSLAHELCHILFDPDEGGLHLSVDYVADKRVHQSEQRARAFAAELLVPTVGLQHLLGTPTRTSSVASATSMAERALAHFGATWQVTVHQICNCEYADDALREALRIQAPSPTGSRFATALPDVDGPSLRVRDLVPRAYEAGHLTDSEARELLRIGWTDPLPWEAQ